MNKLWRMAWLGLSILALGSWQGCVSPPPPGQLAPRVGDEIVVAGQFIHTGTPVVLWMDPGGYDAYRVERRFSPLPSADWMSTSEEVPGVRTPNRYGLRRGSVLTDTELEAVRGGGWSLEQLREVVDQFVLHFDVCGTSRRCFEILHDHRGLSVHFMLDIDGTIYQTLDLKERAWHATTSNTRSVGIEIANIGAYSDADASALQEWYGRDHQGRTIITIPARFEPTGVRTPDFVGHPARSEMVNGEIQARELYQYDFTPQQYRALVRLTAALCRVFPKLRCDYPRDAEGDLIRQKLGDEELENYHGVLGHFHVQRNKVDPGPALQWDYLIENARELLRSAPAHGAPGLLERAPARLLSDQ